MRTHALFVVPALVLALGGAVQAQGLSPPGTGVTSVRPTTGGEGAALRPTTGGEGAVRATQGEGASLRPTTGGEGAVSPVAPWNR